MYEEGEEIAAKEKKEGEGGKKKASVSMARQVRESYTAKV